MSLRGALLLSLAYVLLLATVAFGVPTAISLSDRVDTEVRSQARSQAEVVAVTASPVGVDGGAQSVQPTPAVTALLGADSLPAASRAVTVQVCRPVGTPLST